MKDLYADQVLNAQFCEICDPVNEQSLHLLQTAVAQRAEEELRQSRPKEKLWVIQQAAVEKAHKEIRQEFRDGKFGPRHPGLMQQISVK